MLDRITNIWDRFTRPKHPRDKALRQAALLRLSADLTAPLEEDQICQQAVKGLKDTLGYDVLALFMLDEFTGNRDLVASVGFVDPVTPLVPGEGLSERPLLDGEIHYTPQVTKDPRYFFGMGGSEVDVPIWVGGKVMGVLTAENKKEHAFTHEDFEVLTAAAQLTGLAIEKARLVTAERKRADELDALRTTMAEITAELDLPSLLEAIIKRSADLLDASGGELGLFEESSQEIEIVTSINLGGDYVGLRHKLGEGAMGQVAQTGKPLIIDDYSKWEGRLSQYPQIRGALAAPLNVGERLVGVFTTVSTNPERRFTQADLHLLNMFGQQAAIAIENARLFNQAQTEIGEREKAERELRKYQRDLKGLVKERTAELQESEERYRTLFDRVPVGLYRTTPSGEFVDVNLAMLQILTFSSREELLALNTDSFYVNVEDQARWKALMEQEGLVRDFETQLINQRGEHIWVKETARAIKDEWGRVLYYEGSMEDISERKQAEAELHKYQEHLEDLVAERTSELRVSEKRYRTLFDGVPVGLYRTTPSGKFLDVNQAMVQMLAYPDRESLLEVSTTTFYVDPKEQTGWRALMEREGVVRDYETRGRRFDGSYAWFSDSARAVKDEQGRVRYYEGSLEDISERKKLEEEIRRQKEYYEALFVNSPVAIVTVDRDGKVVSWNPAAENLFGYTQDEAVGRYADDLVANHDSIRTEALMYTDQVLESGLERLRVTTKRTRKDGSFVDVEVLGLPIIVAGKEIGYIAMYHDISERKRYEEEISRQKEYFEALFVNSPVAIVTADLKGKIVSWNPAAERLFGYSSEEVIDENLDDIVAKDDSIREEAEGYTREVIEVGRVQATTKRTRKDGDLLDVELLALPVIVAGEKIGFISIYVNISDLQEARREAIAANQAKSVFLANMSHELRTPLNAILGFTQLMNREPNLTQEQQENLSIINRSGEHLLTLINDVLEMSKIEAGRLTLQDKIFDIVQLLDGLEEIFQIRTEEKGLTLNFERGESVPQYIITDENRLRQVLMNLLGNAVKFTQEGGITLRVEASPQESSSWTDKVRLHFEVEDTGPGIEPEELKAIFEPFIQAGGDQQIYEGTGLGLTISRQFVRLMGGDLTVSSILGYGSIFKFDILVQRVDEDDLQEIRPVRKVLGLAPTQQIYRVLIVEDRETNRQLLVKILEPLGFEIKEATNGKEAIEIWEDWNPHLIFMDMQIPLINGFEATRKIINLQRRHPSQKRIQTSIIALTASAFEEDREKILSVGCDDFMRKPFQIDDVYNMLAKHLGVRLIYAEGTSPSIEDPLQSEEVDLTKDAIRSADFATLPSELIEEFRQTILKADVAQIQDVIERIRDTDLHLANKLADLAYGFEYKKILTAMDQFNKRK